MRRIGLMGKFLGLTEGRFREKVEGNCQNDGTLEQIKGKQLLLAKITARSISKIPVEKPM